MEDRHLSAICISLEQQKAFDRINHNLLIRILNHFDFGQNFLQWINILYSDIYFRVNMNRNLGFIAAWQKKKKPLENYLN